MSDPKNTGSGKIRAVLTGDIVNSTKLSAMQMTTLIDSLEENFNQGQYEFYRGDGFQVYLPDPHDSLKTALRCRCLAKAVTEENAPEDSDIRISVGIGAVESPVTKTGTARGEAFLLSGRHFDELAASGDRLIIAAAGQWPSLTCRILSAELNGIFSAITGKQAEVLVEILKGDTQRDIAARLQKSPSTIHQHLMAANWNRIEACLGHFQEMITLLETEILSK